MTLSCLRKYCLITCLALCIQAVFTFTVHGQMTFNGPFAVGELWNGSATYGFQSVNGKAVMDGAFRFQLTEPDPIDTTLTHHIQIEGNYDKGQKSGAFTFKRKLVSFAGTPSFSNYQAVFPVSGSELTIAAEFKNGRAHGNWRMLEVVIGDGQPIDTLIWVEARFNQGVFTGQFAGKSKRTAIVGQLDASGYLDGPWKFTAVDDLLRFDEMRVFDAGLLREHLFSATGQQAVISYPGLATPDSTQRTRSVEVGDGYFELMDFAREVYSTAGVTGAARRLDERSTLNNAEWRRIIEALYTVDGVNIWDALPGGAVLAPIKSRLTTVAVPNEVRKKMKSAVETHTLALRLAKEVLENPVVEMGRFANEEVGFSHAALQVFYAQLVQLNPLVELLNDSLAPCLNLNRVVEMQIREFQYPETVRFTFNQTEHSRAYNFPHETLSKINDLPLLAALMDLLLMRVEKLKTAIESPLEGYIEEVALREKEAQLLVLRDSIQWYFGGGFPPNGGMLPDNPFYARFAPVFLRRSEDALSSYAVLPAERKSAASDSLIQCFEAVLAFHGFLKQLPLRLAFVKTEYTRTIWNAYTFTYMDEVVKERLFKAYEHVLLPALLNDIENAQSVYLLAVKQENMRRLIDRMLALRLQDTKELERQVRKQSDVAALAQLLGVELYFGEDMP